MADSFRALVIVLASVGLLAACGAAAPAGSQPPGGTPSGRPTAAPAAPAGAATSPASPPSLVTPVAPATSQPAASGPAQPPASLSGHPAPSLGGGPYLDDRSTPQAVVESYYNAINRHEYARAYSYWEPSAAAQQWPSFEVFQQGYHDTASAQVTTGTVSGDVGAGQLYYSVPVVVAAVHTDGARSEFFGCYQLHLARPEIQAVPPFKPLSIRAASLQPGPPNASPTSLLQRACPAP